MKNLTLNNHSYKVLLQDFKQWLDILGYAETTVYNLPNHLKEFFNYLENNNINHLNHIQTEHVTNYYKHLQERPNQRKNGGLSNGYLNKHQQTLFKFKEYLKEHNHKGINIHLKHEAKNHRDSLSVCTLSEIKQLFEATNHSYTEEKNEVVANCDHLEKLKFSPVLPKVFTEHGIMMVANVLTSERAINVSIQIIEVFIKMRKILTDNLSVKLDIEEIKKKLSNQSKNIELVFQYLDELTEKKDNEKPRIKIGYKKE